jgi:hypothetical protein
VLPPGYEMYNEEEKKEFLKCQIDKFFDSMPDCPNCNSRCFADIRWPAEYPFYGYFCKKCGTDLTKTGNSKSMGISYYKYSIMNAWWYEVVNDDKPETPDNH